MRQKETKEGILRTEYPLFSYIRPRESARSEAKVVYTHTRTFARSEGEKR